MSGTRYAVSGTGYAIYGIENAISGTENTISGTGNAISGTEYTVSGTGYLVSGTGYVVSGIGYAIAYVFPEMYGNSFIFDLQSSSTSLLHTLPWKIGLLARNIQEGQKSILLIFCNFSENINKMLF